MSAKAGKKGRGLRGIIAVLLLIAVGISIFALRGEPEEIATKQVVGGKEQYCSNQRFARSLLKGSGAAEFVPFAFDIEKDPRIYRIFVLGGSVARGFPDEYYDFGRMLELMLDDRYAGTDFEIINVAMRGVSAEHLSDIAESCTRFEPDLMIVHSGQGDPKVKDLSWSKSAVLAGAHVIVALNRASDLRGAEGVSSIDLRKVLEGAASYGVNDDNLFFDRIHYRFGGSYVVARALLDAVESVLPEDITQYKRDKAVPGINECEERLVYTDVERYMSIRRVIGLLPYLSEPGDSGRANVMEELEAESGRLQGRINAEFNKLLPRYKELTGKYPDDWKLSWKVADYAYRFYKNPRLAFDQATKVLAVVPHPGAHVVLMRIAINEGRLSEAEKHANILIEMRPHRAEHYFDMGEIHKLRGEYEAAIKQFSKGIKISPGVESVVAYTHLAELYEAEGRPGKAVKVLYKALEDEPRQHAGRAYINLGLLLGSQNRDDEAVEVLGKAIAIYGNEIPGRDEVVRLLERLGRADLAAELGVEGDQ